MLSLLYSKYVTSGRAKYNFTLALALLLADLTILAEGFLLLLWSIL